MLAHLRREYTLNGLRRSDLVPDPIAQFKNWFDQATATTPNAEAVEINAMTLATADKDGNPSARIVLLKGVDQRGFIFFTNYESRKGRELAENPKAALVFYWPELERQVCIAGVVSKVSAAESEQYFQLRPRGSRIAAWASFKVFPATGTGWTSGRDKVPSSRTENGRPSVGGTSALSGGPVF